MNDSRRVSTMIGALFGIGSMGSSSAAVVLAPMARDLAVLPLLAASRLARDVPG